MALFRHSTRLGIGIAYPHDTTACYACPFRSLLGPIEGMDTEIATAIIAATSALAGSAVGGVASYFSTRSMRKLEWQLSEIEREIASRRALYGQFLAESNKWIVRSFDQKANSFAEMQELLNLHSEISLISSKIGAKAKEILSCVLDHHQKDKETSGTYPTLRDAFIALCQQEVKDLRSAV